jgi:hypothetical protein
LKLSPKPFIVMVLKFKIAVAFAEFFDNKVRQLVHDSVIAPNIYNGKRKICCNNSFFKGKNSILDCVSTLKIKNCEG